MRSAATGPPRRQPVPAPSPIRPVAREGTFAERLSVWFRETTLVASGHSLRLCSVVQRSIYPVTAATTPSSGVLAPPGRACHGWTPMATSPAILRPCVITSGTRTPPRSSCPSLTRDRTAATRRSRPMTSRASTRRTTRACAPVSSRCRCTAAHGAAASTSSRT